MASAMEGKESDLRAVGKGADSNRGTREAPWLDEKGRL